MFCSNKLDGNTDLVVQGGLVGLLHTFIMLTADRGDWSVSRLGRFTPVKRAWVQWMGLVVPPWGLEPDCPIVQLM
jgi:hypothetical protein